VKKHNRIAVIVLTLIAASVSLPAADPPPLAYADLYATLEQRVLGFEAAVDSQWNGVKGSTAFVGSVSSANGHRGLELLEPGALDGVMMELDGLKAMGVQTAFLTIPYPVLHPPFHTGSGEYQAVLDFYRAVSQGIRDRGMGLVVESPVLFTQGGFSQWPASRLDGIFNLNANPGFDVAAFNAGRAAVALTIAQELSPDYLSVFNEPDTSADMTGIAELNTVSGARQALDTILAGLQGERAQGLKVGAGIGTWHSDYQLFVDSFVQAEMDFFDIHVFYTSNGKLDRAFEIADTVSANGMTKAISQGWLMKARDIELMDPANFPINVFFARDVYSFWSPLDCKFTEAMVKYSHLKNLEYLNPFFSRYFRAYLPYNWTTLGLSPHELDVMSMEAANDAIVTGAYTETGRCYEAAILGQPDTTPPDQPLAPTAELTDLNTIYLSWPKASDNVGVAGYAIYRNGEKVATTTRNDYLDEGLEEAKTFEYRVAAFDVFENESVPSPAVEQSTPDVTPPTRPIFVTSTPVSTTEVRFQWWPALDNVATTGYRVYLGTSADQLQLVKLVTEPTYTRTGFMPDTTLYFAVDAVDAAKNISERSVVISGKSMADWQKPTVPTQVVAAAVSQSQIDLSWAASTDDYKVYGYKVFASTTGFGFAFIGFSETTSWSHTNLPANQMVYYRIEAIDYTGKGSGQSPAVSATTLSNQSPPTQPTNLVAAAVSDRQINLSWGASEDDTGVQGYKIYRASGGGGMALVAFSEVTSWANPPVLAPNETYSYIVQAIDLNGNASPVSNVASATTLPSPDTGDPAAAVLSPANGATISGGSVGIAGWGTDVRRSLYDTPSGIDYLEVLVDGAVVGQIPGGLGYIMFDSRTVSNGAHTITIRAWDKAGRSGLSTPFTVNVQN